MSLEGIVNSLSAWERGQRRECTSWKASKLNYMHVTTGCFSNDDLALSFPYFLPSKFIDLSRD